MPRKIFFSFHYQRDSWRVNQVRNSWLTHGTANSFIDAAAWETIRRKGAKSIKGWIDRQLEGTSVTVVLIGQETSDREYVLYEIERSYDLGKGLLGIYIHQLKNEDGDSDFWAGANPFTKIELKPTWWFEELFPPTLADSIHTYDWVDDDGYENMPAWIENAACNARR
ncbi:MAG TPA: TIR domain-containing protein [Gammaproteobacteria bacterium]|nr:TIR domain-containing protein [Gammaproteobacteria bacterium]